MPAKKTFGDFRKKIKKDYPEFPNMESKEGVHERPS
jgi:hypothetical protein